MDFEGIDVADVIDWAEAAARNLGALLPIGIFLLATIFGRDKKKEQRAPARPQGKPAGQPATGPVAMPTFDIPGGPFMPVPAAGTPRPRRPREEPSPWGSAFERDEEKALRWGSVFDDPEGGKLKWGSAFDGERERTKWGFDDAEWGSAFGPKKHADPKITVG